jgi:uncharacterized protein (TIGR02600 family)
VIVLVLLVLMLGLIMAFFSGVTTQRTFSRTSADAASVQRLADAAVNIVMSQIVDATGTSAGTSNDGTTLAWASQPGMIRTYDDGGLPRNFYKLYSSGAMIVAGSGFSITTDDPNQINGGWNSAGNVGIYTDLNAPVLVTDTTGGIVISTTNGTTVSSGTYTAVYPIIDPFAENTLPATTGTSNGVSGFSMSSRPAFVGGNVPASSLSAGADPTATVPGSGTTANPAPMPIKWLYVLSQGQVIAPDPTASSNGVLQFTGSNAGLVSGTNPIVGRIAFWADDDSCKVNINTASEGVYWDTPRVFSLEDCGQFTGNSLNESTSTPGMAICQPVQQEYQRYPGHPATTSLSAIFGNLMLSSGNPSASGAFSMAALELAGYIGSTGSSVSPFNQYYSIAPRVAPGGSNAGTTLTGTDQYSGTISESGTSALIPSQNRLYASVDELMFTGSATNVSGTTARITNPNAAGSTASTTPTVITKKVLEKTRFFLTACSNAPEVTLFNTPRVSMWPVWDPGQIWASGTIPITSGSTARTAYDNLAAFCGTVGGKTYYFTRANSRSNTYDYTQTVTDPATGLTRNQDLYKYLETLTSENIPGFGGNFLTKYPAGSNATDRDQILTLMYDYIRCINMADSTNNYPFTPLFQVQVSATDPRLDPTDPYRTDSDINNNPDGTGGLFPRGAGEVIPIKINATSGSTMGVGRCLTISEADLLFYATATQNGTAAAGQTNAFSAIFLLQFASPMQGLSPMRSSLKYSVTGLNQYSVTVPSSTGTGPIPLGLQGGGTNYIELSDIQTGGGLGLGGVEGPAEGLYSLSGTNTFGAASWDYSIKKTGTAGGAAFGNYPFFATAPIKFTPSVSDKTFMLSGSATDIVITLSTQDSTPVTVQTVHLQFPNGRFLIPTIAQISGTSFNTRLAAATVGQGNSTGSPGSNGVNLPVSALVSGSAPGAGDTVIGVQPAGVFGNIWNSVVDPTGGDIRMIAPLPNVPDTYFRPHLNYLTTSGSAGVQYAHGMMTAQGNPYESGVVLTVPPSTHAQDIGLVGSLVSPVNYYGYNHHSSYGPNIQNPYVPSFVGNTVRRAAASGAGAWGLGYRSRQHAGRRLYEQAR